MRKPARTNLSLPTMQSRRLPLEPLLSSAALASFPVHCLGVGAGVDAQSLRRLDSTFQTQPMLESPQSFPCCSWGLRPRVLLVEGTSQPDVEIPQEVGLK